eukprot:9277830-Ditylum_brightwellii.AAC.1
MSLTLITIQKEENIDAVESNTDDGSEADEIDNAFHVGGAVVVRWEWEEFLGDLVIPDIPDHYNGPKGSKDSIEH